MGASSPPLCLSEAGSCSCLTCLFSSGTPFRRSGLLHSVLSTAQPSPAHLAFSIHYCNSFSGFPTTSNSPHRPFRLQDYSITTTTINDDEPQPQPRPRPQPRPSPSPSPRLPSQSTSTGSLVIPHLHPVVEVVVLELSRSSSRKSASKSIPQLRNQRFFDDAPSKPTLPSAPWRSRFRVRTAPVC